MSKRRKRKLTRHHNRNKSKGGKSEVGNIIMLIKEKHECYHILFKNKTFEEAGRLLLRASKCMKRRKNGKN